MLNQKIQNYKKKNKVRPATHGAHLNQSENFSAATARSTPNASSLKRITLRFFQLLLPSSVPPFYPCPQNLVLFPIPINLYLTNIWYLLLWCFNFLCFPSGQKFSEPTQTFSIFHRLCRHAKLENMVTISICYICTYVYANIKLIFF